jgi:hypothetical protein
VPVQDSVACLYAAGTDDMLFDQLGSYGPRGFTDVLAVVTLICLTLYFVTSSDSGSLVVDVLSANGHPEPPVFQRIFWAFTEGATAIALLYSGSNGKNATASLRALQSASIICGLPYTFVLFFATLALYLVCREEAGELDPNRKGFGSFLFKVCPKSVVVNTLAPGIQLGRAVAECGKWPGAGLGKQVVKFLWAAIFSSLYYGAVLLIVVGAATIYNWQIVGGVFYCGFGVLCGLVRTDVRLRFGILHGDLFTDLICGVFVPMFSITQMQHQLDTDDAALQKKLDAKSPDEVGDRQPAEDNGGSQQGQDGGLPM